MHSPFHVSLAADRQRTLLGEAAACSQRTPRQRPSIASREVAATAASVPAAGRQRVVTKFDTVTSR